MKILTETRRFTLLRRFLPLFLLSSLFLSGAWEMTLAQGGGVVVTFTNQTPEKVVVRRITPRGKPAGPNPDTGIAAGASVNVPATPGESFSVILGTRQIGLYTATTKASQQYPIARGGGGGGQFAPQVAPAGLVTVTFTNTTPKVITLNRLDPGNVVQTFGTIAPGKVMSMQSVPGQVWLFLNSNNKEFGRYQVTSAPRQAIPISQGGGGAGPVNNGGVAIPPATLAGNTGSQVDGQQAQQLVNYHNQKRQEVGSGPLTWSPQISQYAQGRADTIARTKNFAHLPQGQNPYGENLAQGGSSGGASGYSVVTACSDWYAEKAKMPRGAQVMTVDLFNRGVGHYTQMVWKGTTQIGAGIASFQQNGFTMNVVVCCYNPPGNFIGGQIF
jgi:uncharacterized protein YkwD